MARGDFTLFEEFIDRLGEGEHDLGSDTLKLGIIDDTVGTVPTAADETPQWGDYSASEVAATGGYVADGIELAYTGVTRWEEVDGTATLDADDVELSQDGSGFTDGYYGILYNSTNASNMAIGFVDLDGPVSEQDGPITIAWNESGILTIS